MYDNYADFFATNLYFYKVYNKNGFEIIEADSKIKIFTKWELKFKRKRSIIDIRKEWVTPSKMKLEINSRNTEPPSISREVLYFFILSVFIGGKNDLQKLWERNCR